MARAKRIVKRVALGLIILVALAVIIDVACSWWTGRQLDQRVTALRAAGEPTRIAELAPAPVPADEDAAVLLASVAGEVESLLKQADQIYDPVIEKLSGEKLDQLRERLGEHERLFSTVHQASLRPSYRSQLDYSVGSQEFMEEFLEEVQQWRNIPRLLSMRVDVLLADGQPDEALQAGLDMLRLTRLWDQEPTMTCYLVSLAMRGVGIDMINRTLRDGPVSLAGRQELERELARHQDMKGNWVSTERAFGLDRYRDLNGGLLGQLLLWRFNCSAIKYLDLIENLEQLEQQPWHETVDVRAKDLVDNEDDVLVKLFIPVIDITRDARDRVGTELNCLRVLNALQRYEEEHGKLPAELSQLDLPTDVTIDPFTGKPLHWKKTDDGWLVYSVGKDRVDNGGAIEDAKDYGIGPVDWQVPSDQSDQASQSETH